MKINDSLSKYVELKQFTYLILDNKFNTFLYTNKIHEDHETHSFKLFNLIKINGLQYISNVYYIKLYDEYNDIKKHLQTFKLIQNALKLSSSFKYIQFYANDTSLGIFLNGNFLYKLISNNKTLTKLIITSLSIDDYYFDIIIKALQNNNNIKKIYLYNNVISNINMLYELIINNNSLKEIDLQDNNYIEDFSVINQINSYFKNNNIKKEIQFDIETLKIKIIDLTK